MVKPILPIRKKRIVWFYETTAKVKLFFTSAALTSAFHYIPTPWPTVTRHATHRPKKMRRCNKSFKD